MGTDSGEHTGYELLDLLTDLGVCSKQRVRGGPQGRGGWVGNGWSANELAAASRKIGRPVAAITWGRFVKQPEPGKKPYTGNGNKLPAMAATLRYLHEIACTGVVVSDTEIMGAWAAAKGVPAPPVPPSGLNVVKSSVSVADALDELLEAARSSTERVQAYKDAARRLTGAEQSQVLAFLAALRANDVGGDKGR